MTWGRAERNAKVLHHIRRTPDRNGPVVWTCDRSARGYVEASESERALLRCFECCRIVGVEYGTGMPDA